MPLGTETEKSARDVGTRALLSLWRDYGNLAGLVPNSPRTLRPNHYASSERTRAVGSRADLIAH